MMVARTLLIHGLLTAASISLAFPASSSNILGGAKLSLGQSRGGPADLRVKAATSSITLNGPVQSSLVPPTRGGASFLNSRTRTALKATTSSSDPSNPTLSTSTLSYYLLWSPGVLKRLVVSSSALVAFHTLVGPGLRGQLVSISSYLVRPAASVLPNVVLPLLGSACCLIQIIINMFVGAGGCAGFNSFLGPLRPFFLSILGYLTILSRPANLSTTLVRLSIAFLPELLHVWNSRVRFQWLNKQGALQEGGDQSSLLYQAVVQVDIPGMGCVACINKIDSSLRQCASSNPHVKIEDASSWLDPDRPKGGRAKVKVRASSEQDLKSATQSILESIEKAGFDGSRIESIA